MSSLNLLQHLVEVDSLLILSPTSTQVNSTSQLVLIEPFLVPPGLPLTQMLVHVHSLLLLPLLLSLSVPIHFTD